MIYLDNAATTRPCPACVADVGSMLTDHFANPSSLHGPGIDAMKEIIAARSALADALGVERDTLTFTSGGTEANNLALFGAAYANRRRGKRIVTTAIEHESIIQTADQLEAEGFEVIRLQPDKTGNITKQQIESAITPDTILVSVMRINNEVGSILPVECIRRAVQKAGAPALIHTDCVQTFGKVPLRPDKLGVDLMTVTAHKIHGPKGVGALYVRKGVRILPRTFGGEQEKKLRPGTEAAPLIAGFGAAVSALPDLRAQNAAVKELNAYTKERLAEIPGLTFNSGDQASPYIINICVPTFMRSQTIIQELSANYGICVSSGSACAKGKRSHVLTAMGLPEQVIDKSIRLSFSGQSTQAEADAFVDALRDLVKKHPKE